jgi:hypothetical protein
LADHLNIHRSLPPVFENSVIAAIPYRGHRSLPRHPDEGVTDLVDPSQREQIHDANRTKTVSRSLRMVALLIRRRWRRVVTIAVELVLHAVLVVAYFFVVLQWLNEPLVRLSRENLAYYAVASILLILGQGMLLDIVTSIVPHLVRRMNDWRRE